MDQDYKQEQLKDLKEFKAHKGWKICQDLSDKWLEQKNKELVVQLRQRKLDEAYGTQKWIDGFLYRDIILEERIKALTIPDETENPSY